MALFLRKFTIDIKSQLREKKITSTETLAGTLSIKIKIVSVILINLLIENYNIIFYTFLKFIY